MKLRRKTDYDHLNPYQKLQILLLVALIAFGIALLCGVTVPEENAQWFDKVWNVLLIVLSPAALAAIVLKASGENPTQYPKDIPPIEENPDGQGK